MLVKRGKAAWSLPKKQSDPFCFTVVFLSYQQKTAVARWFYGVRCFGFVTPNPSFVTFGFCGGKGAVTFVLQMSNAMYKMFFLLLLLALVTGFLVLLAAQGKTIQISEPVLAGSPLIVINP